MSDLQALCMKCRQKGKEHQMQKMENVKVEETKKNRFMARGKCAVCGTNQVKFLSKEDAQKYK